MATAIELLAQLVGAIEVLQRTAEEQVAILARMERVALESAEKPAASDCELDTTHGDPLVKKDPKRWAGPPVAPRVMSKCSPAYLDGLAELYDWSAALADKNGDKSDNGTPLSFFRRQDARKARGWARRIRAGWKPPEPSMAPGGTVVPPAEKW